MTDPQPFRRPRHNDIFHALHSLNAPAFKAAECYFGGGTAIVLLLGEYRESVDLDFLCASQVGYRSLRQALWGQVGLGGLQNPSTPLKSIRDIRMDHYGIRTVVTVGSTIIKFEIVREARIPLSGAADDRFGVPHLSRVSMFAEKLLANADRWADKSVLSRDIIDLSMMTLHWGPIPEEAWTIARAAYGDTARKAYDQAVLRIRDMTWLDRCMAGMAMDPALADDILGPYGGPLAQED